ncbi:unnamed protein product, partial [Ilex paraguariensis]
GHDGVAVAKLVDLIALDIPATASLEDTKEQGGSQSSDNTYNQRNLNVNERKTKAELVKWV